MSTVAIAGGTSPGLGRAMVIGILEAYPKGEWKPIILSRSSKRPIWLRAIDPDGSRVQVHAVDYDDEDNVASALEGAHTLLSVILAKDGSQSRKLVTLLNAAVKAGCKRYAPSQWGNGIGGWADVPMLRMMFEGVWEECVKKSDRIECARFNGGGFINYLGIGAYDSTDALDEDIQLKLAAQGNGYIAGDDTATQGVDREGDMADGKGGFLFSPSSATAEIPMRDDGGFPMITGTTIRDVGRFAAASLELPKWEADMSIAGDTIRADELLEIAQAVTGRTFQVKKLTRAELEAEIQTLEMPQDMMKQLWLDLKVEINKDAVGHGVLNPVVNALCPSIKPTTHREYLEKHWRRR